MSWEEIMQVLIIATVEDKEDVPSSAVWKCEAAVKEILEKEGIAVSNMTSRKE